MKGPSRIQDWRAARTHPATYPGETPAGDYLILDDWVLPLRFLDPHNLGSAVCEQSGETLGVDSELARRGLPSLAERTPVISYGGNRNPATLTLKLSHYAYSVGRGGVAMPVLKGRLRAAEAVAAGVSGQGYLYADLVLDDPCICAGALEVWVALADRDQLRVLHDSEGVERQWYAVAMLDGLEFDQLTGLHRGLAYVTDLACPVLPSTGQPLGFSSIPADSRRLEAATPVDMLDRYISEHNLRAAVSQRTGLIDDLDLSANLIKYLNGQWWYHRHTGDPAVPPYYEVIEVIKAALNRSTRHFGVVRRLRAEGRILEGSERFSPGSILSPD